MFQKKNQSTATLQMNKKAKGMTLITKRGEYHEGNDRLTGSRESGQAATCYSTKNRFGSGNMPASQG